MRGAFLGRPAYLMAGFDRTFTRYFKFPRAAGSAGPGATLRRTGPTARIVIATVNQLFIAQFGTDSAGNFTVFGYLVRRL